MDKQKHESPITERDREQVIRDLHQEIQEKSLLLSDLEVIIEDYQTERLKLLKELRALKEKWWELTAGTDPGPKFRLWNQNYLRVQ